MLHVFHSRPRRLELLILVAYVAHSAHGGTHKAYAASDNELNDYRDLAIACEPGPASDALLRLSAVAVKESPRWRQSLIEQAFELARNVLPETATEPVPVGFTDTVPATTSISAWVLKVDRLSLQVRAAEAMLDFDRARALEMFEYITMDPIPALSCNSLVVPKLDFYYQAARVFAERSFANSEAYREKQEAFLAARVRNVTSSVEVFPTVGLLADVEITPQMLSELVTMLSAAVKNIGNDDRSFTVALLEEESTQRLRTLVARCRTNGVDATALMAAMREFYERHLQAARCSDTARDEALSKRAQHGIAAFNALANDFSDAIVPLAEKYSPSHLEDSPAAADLWTKSRDHTAFIKRLRALGSDKLSSNADHNAHLEELTMSVDDWVQPDELDALEFFILKAKLLNQVLRIPGSVDTFRLALQANRHVFEYNKEVQLSQPAVWISSVMAVLSYVRSKGADAAEMARQEFEKSSEPALRLYAGLDRRLSRLGQRSDAN